MVIVGSAEVLAPQLQPQIAGELAGAVAKTSRIDWFSRVA
jgi:hypothetical protein